MTICPAQTLTMRLYDYSALTAEETGRATTVAGVPFAHSGIHVRWLYCRGALAAEPAACQLDLKINDIVLRLVRAERSASTSSEAKLGSAIVGANGGQYATVFVPAVRALATEWNIAFDLVLGYAIAHEAGHCLLGPKHGSAGLMRSPWKRQDAREIAQLRLGLSRQEARRAAVRCSRPSGLLLEISRATNSHLELPAVLKAAAECLGSKMPLDGSP